MACVAMTKSGKKCGVPTKGKYCFFHDPSNADKLKTIRSKGGKAGRGKLRIFKTKAGSTFSLIPLTPGLRSLRFKNPPQAVIVDKEDFAQLSKVKWRAAYHTGERKWYATRGSVSSGRTCTTYLHRKVMELDPGYGRVRFKNGNTMDCRKRNLVLRTKSAAKIVCSRARQSQPQVQEQPKLVQKLPQGGIRLVFEISAEALKLLK